VKGSYILLIGLPEEQTITIGSLGDLFFPAGYYAYVGSAMGGVKSRLSRRLQENRRPHWHIDYLLQKASIMDVFVCETKDRAECTIARALSQRLDSITGLGSSDCKCQSHLFFASEKSQLKSTIKATLSQLSKQSKLTKTSSIEGG